MSDDATNEAYGAAVAVWAAERGCNCSAVDIGVGVMHDPRCGLPSPDDIANAMLPLLRTRDKEIARLRATLDERTLRFAKVAAAAINLLVANGPCETLTDDDLANEQHHCGEGDCWYCELNRFASALSGEDEAIARRALGEEPDNG